jgi:hypothetical protein
MSKDDAGSFWNWFQREVAPSLMLDEVPDNTVVDELDARMLELGVSWELGPAPDGSDDWGLAVSFGADLDRLPRAETVARSAPRMPKIQVFLGKPPKRWNGVLELPSGDNWVQFSTANWWCFIVPMGGGMAIMVSPEDEGEADESTVALAAAIAVQSELGELRYAREVRDLSIVPRDHTANLPGIRCRMRELGSTTTS